MSAIARYFKYIGKNVTGYDRTSTELTKILQKEGFDIHYSDDINLIPSEIKLDKENVLVIYTPAIHKDNTELNHFIENGYEVMKRSKVLGLIIADKKGIAVSGTHGKTTISTMLAHIFNNSDLGCNAFLGGIATNYNSNLISNKESEYVVVEADEFDRSFLQLSPNLAIITSIDADHLDIYGEREQMVQSFNQFVNQIKPNGKLLIKSNIADEINVRADVLKYTYSYQSKSDFYVRDYKIENGKYIINLASPFGIIDHIEIGIPGKVNVENAVAAIAIAVLEGIESEQIKNALSSFRGVKRRFEYIINKNDLVFIDDYAHHPEELNACISSIKELYPEKKITGIFQPHLYTRTRDFADDFAKSLSALDELILLDIYPARELPIEGVSSEIIFKNVHIENKTLTTKENLLNVLENRSFEVLLTLGAGDIDMIVEPIKELIIKRIQV